jgi:hypothetical protein
MIFPLPTAVMRGYPSRLSVRDAHVYEIDGMVPLDRGVPSVPNVIVSPTGWHMVPDPPTASRPFNPPTKDCWRSVPIGRTLLCLHVSHSSAAPAWYGFLCSWRTSEPARARARRVSGGILNPTEGFESESKPERNCLLIIINNSFVLKIFVYTKNISAQPPLVAMETRNAWKEIVI